MGTQRGQKATDVGDGCKLWPKGSIDEAKSDASEGSVEGEWKRKAKCRKLRRCRNRRGGETKGGQCPWGQAGLCGGGRACLCLGPGGAATVITFEGAKKAFVDGLTLSSPLGVWVLIVSSVYL